jgi:AcrR family transcriptional regulator
MDEIARTAGVGKDTLYRRWGSKELLVQYLLTVLATEKVPVPAEEDPNFALFIFLQDIVRLNTKSDFGAIVAGIVGESARNPRLAQAFQQFWDERRALAGELVRRVLPDPVAESEIERLLDHVLGPIYYRLLLTGDPIEDEYLWDLVLSISRSPESDTNHEETNV